jgi:hypothetical protein
MRKYRSGVGSIPRVEYGIALVRGLAEFAECEPHAKPFAVLNDKLLVQHQQRLALRKPLLEARTNLRLVEFRVDRVIRAAFSETKTADGGRRGPGPICKALFPEGLTAVIAPKGRKQLQPTIDLVDRLMLAAVPGIDAYRTEWLPRLQTAQKDLETAIAQCTAAEEAHTKAFKAEKALRDQHYNEVDRIMGLVRAAFPRDREMQDIVFPPVDDSDGTDAAEQPDEPEDPPEPIKAAAPSVVKVPAGGSACA